MKNINKSLLILSVAAVSFASCAKQEQDQYTPAAKETGTTYYFSVETPGSYPVTSDEVTKVSVPVLRTLDTEQASVKIAVTDTSKIFFSEGTAEITVAFASGEKLANIEIPVDFSVLSQDFGHEYGVELSISENISQYALSNYTIKIFAPEPWTSLGYGVWEDAWLFEDTFEKVEFFQNDLNPNIFKIGWSAAICENYDDENPEDWPEFFTFEIIPVGEKIGDITITQEGLVYYDIFNSGLYVSNYSDYISLVHCSAFSSSSFNTEAMYAKNKVVAYQDPDENGKVLPAVIELAPAYYLLDYGAGWASQANNVNMVLTFPGVEIKDYSTDVSFEGILSSADGDYALVDVTLGEDVTEAAIAIAPGEDPYDALALILDEDESVITVTKSGEVKIPLPEEVAEAYSIVIAPVVDGEVLADEAAYDTFAYKDFSISVAASEPVINDDEVSGTTTVSFVFGADVEYAKLALFEGKSSDLTEEDLAIFDDEESEDVIIVKHADDTFDVVLPEEGDYTLVAVSYAFEQAWNISVRDIEFVLVNPWETVGTATWTDAFFGPWFSADALSYDIELQANNEVPGFYRLVNVYGEAFLYNEEGDWDDSKDYYLKLHAEDPDAVWFETFDTGCDWGYGDFLLASDMGLYIEEYGLEAVLEAVDAGDIDNTFGNLSNNVITFPVDGVLKAMAGYNGGAWYYGNHAAVFTITLNFDASASGIQKKHASRSLGMAQKASRNLSAVSIARGRLSSKNISKEAPVISTL